MWFVSRRRYDELLRERDGLQERLFRTNTATRKTELDRDQAKANAQNLIKQLDAASLEIGKLTNEQHQVKVNAQDLTKQLDVALQQISKMADERDQAKANAQNLTKQLDAALQEVAKATNERDTLLVRLRTIRDHVGLLPGDPTVNGMATQVVKSRAGDGAE